MVSLWGGLWMAKYPTLPVEWVALEISSTHFTNIFNFFKPSMYNNHMPGKVLDWIIYPYPNVNGYNGMDE